MIRVVIVDDQEMIRLGLRGILKTRNYFAVVGEAADGLQAVAVISSTRPDVVLMDIRMPGVDGVEAVRRIRANHQLDAVKILVLTTFEDDQNVIRAIKAGAQGFLGKNLGPTDLIKAVEAIAAGHASLSAAAASTLVSHVSSPPEQQYDSVAVEAVSRLTSRERAVAVEAAAGLTNDQIATKLFISPHTVKTHLNRAMTKTGARDRAQLVILIFRAGLAEQE
ncbi:response regulator [Pseudarthrobacter sp. NPDC058329]|uniref:response regulator n=1 Tax=Pseudarthrobacter sp. NPDC058329 TaxID=3346448 RepID=UPI0036DC3346